MTVVIKLCHFEKYFCPGTQETNGNKLVHLVVEGKEGVKFLHCQPDALRGEREGKQVKRLQDFSRKPCKPAQHPELILIHADYDNWDYS